MIGMQGLYAHMQAASKVAATLEEKQLLPCYRASPLISLLFNMLNE